MLEGWKHLSVQLPVRWCKRVGAQRVTVVVVEYIIILIIIIVVLLDFA